LVHLAPASRRTPYASAAEVSGVQGSLE
jgi:hypothetical protein